MFCWVKCPTSCRIPHLAGQSPKSCKAERKTVILYFAISQMPFVLIVHMVTVFLCVLRTLMMGSLKIHSSHVQRRGWLVLQHKAELQGKPEETGRSKSNTDSTVSKRVEVKILINSLKPWHCSMTFWAPFSQCKVLLSLQQGWNILCVSEVELLLQMLPQDSSLWLPMCHVLQGEPQHWVFRFFSTDLRSPCAEWTLDLIIQWHHLQKLKEQL